MAAVTISAVDLGSRLQVVQNEFQGFRTHPQFHWLGATLVTNGAASDHHAQAITIGRIKVTAATGYR